MKLIFLSHMARKLYLCALLLVTVLSGVAQDKVTFSRQTMTRRNAINEIKRQTTYSFAINHSKFDDAGTVYFTSLNLPLKDALSQLLAGTDQTYLIQGQQILILTIAGNKEEPEEPQPKIVQTTPKKRPAAQPVYNPPPRNDRPRQSNRDHQAQPAYGNQPNQPPYRNEPILENIENEVQQYINNTLPPSTGNQPIKNEVAEPVRQQQTAIQQPVTQQQLSPPTTSTQKQPNKSLTINYTPEPVHEYKSFLTKAPARFAVKTNLLYDFGALTPNLGVEIGLTNKLSLELMVGYNPFGDSKKEDEEEKDEKMRKHLLIKPEIRYWLAERSNGHFFGIHPFFANYEVSGYKVPLIFDKEYRYKGNSFGVGVSYGYHWMLTKNWGLEFNVGAGFAFMDYDKFSIVDTMEEDGKFKKKYFGPTSLGIKAIYIIK